MTHAPIPPSFGTALRDDVRLLHSGLADLGLAVPDTEVKNAVVGEGTRKAITEFQKDRGLRVTGVLDRVTAAALDAAIEQSSYVIEGRVASPDRPGVEGLTIVVVDHDLKGDVKLASTTSDARGRYTARFQAAPLRARKKESPDLQVRVLAGDTLVGKSEIIYNAGNSVTINVPLAAGVLALPSEHETLTAALQPHVPGTIADLKESDERQDITYLANKTGWDARAVAMTALAEQLSLTRLVQGRTAIEIKAPFFYALLRAGLPANPATLFRLAPDAAQSIWRQAVKSGVIQAALEKEIPATTEAFRLFAADHALNTPALPGASTLRELMKRALPDAAKQQQVAAFLVQHRGDDDAFWHAVRAALGDDDTARLQLDAQLAHLTINNAPLIDRLQRTEVNRGLKKSADLARLGYASAKRWTPLITDAPSVIPGKTDAERRANYAEMLAAQVRLSFPTAVVASMIRDGSLAVTQGTEIRERVTAFLDAHQDKFEIGMQAVDQYIQRNNVQGVAPEVRAELKRLQRVYQITPDDKAFTALLARNVHSAFHVVRYEESEFVSTFAGDVGGEQAARLVHAKARQVHGAVLNLATSYLLARRGVPIGVHSPPSVIDPAPVPAHAGDVVAYATLESLFGSMDYCACDHCRSILSPAAYLVDLLQFLDRPVNTANNAQAVLLERRPDIAALPLTCENTNTPLPHIDLVNEVLEYYITHGLSMAGYSGHSTDAQSAPDELMANPQFIDNTAYDALKDPTAISNLFPPPLPFHRPLEALRRYLSALGVPLREAMENLRVSEAVDRATDADYGWRDTLMEWVGLSRIEYRLLTDRTLTVNQLYGYGAAAALPNVLSELSKFKLFARRLDITYQELTKLLETRFVNPAGSLIPKLERLHVPFSTLAALKNNAITDSAFDALLPAGLDPVEFGGSLGGNAAAAVRAWVRNQANYDRIMGLITIANPTHPGDMAAVDELELRYANPDNAANKLRGIDFVRLLRFIRLWKKLGWTIEQTDAAIEALYPASQLPTAATEAENLERLDLGFQSLIPRLGHVLQVMERLKVTPKKGLESLLACFSTIGVHGRSALYRKMFMGAAPPAQNPAFLDDGYGNVLDDAAARVLQHSDTLRGAFGLTGAEFAQIVEKLQFDANTGLTLENISAIYRRAWLARTLRISVREVLELIEWTRLNPFAAPDPPEPAVMKFIRLTESLRSGGLKPTKALFLIWNQDLTGTAAPDQTRVMEFARTLRLGFSAIENAFAVAEDPNGEIARSRMTLVYGSDATDFFFGLLNDTLVSDTAFSTSTAALPTSVANAAGGRLAYDDLRKRLTFSGVLSTTMRDQVKTEGAGITGFADAMDSLYTLNQAAVGGFFAKYPELLPLYNTYVGSALSPQEKRSALLASFLPELKRRRKQAQALVIAGATARVSSELAQAILDNTPVLHSLTDSARPAVNDLTAMEPGGLSVTYYWRDTATGGFGARSDLESILDYSGTGAVRLPVNPTPGPISGVWTGHVEAPESGFFNFEIEADAGATVRLSVGGVVRPLTQTANVWKNNTPIELVAGALVPIALTVERVTTRLRVRWESTGRGWEVIPDAALYSGVRTDRIRRVLLALLKSNVIADALKLSAAELGHLAAATEYRVSGEGWVNALAALDDPTQAAAAQLLDVLTGLLDFAHLKKAISPNDERLLEVIRAPTAALPNGELALLTLTGWQAASLDALLLRFGALARTDLSRVAVFKRVYDAYRLVNAAGVSAGALSSATTNEPAAATVSSLLVSLRARYDRADWLEVLRPINDQLRILQRNALVAYVLRRMAANAASAHIDTPDKLFEYFLVDVQMQPCMQTTRILHATASVQLFIDRCLMNLEPRVPAANLDAGQWAWMKRYRVWEANRKVFLWPENWLEPELRDDQSPFFKEVMGELLQSDITEDSAAAALQNYLGRLDEVAKLEQVGIHHVELSPGEQDDVVHVVARTSGAHRKYYYRRQDNGVTWRPWDQIKLDIEDNPVIPVVWKNRLFLFWLRILTRTPVDPETQVEAIDSVAGTAKVGNMTVAEAKNEAREGAKREARSLVEAILCWSEYFNGKWQAVRTSDPDRPTSLGLYGIDARSSTRFDRSKLRLWPRVESDGLRILITGDRAISWFHLYNTHSLPVRAEESTYRAIPVNTPLRFLYTTYDKLTAMYRGAVLDFKSRDVLRNLTDASGDVATDPTHALAEPWTSPFIYQDHRHAYYVTTRQEWVELTRSKWVGMPAEDGRVDVRIPPILYEPFIELKPPMPDPPPDPYQKGDMVTGVTDELYATFELNKRSNIVAGLGSAGTVRYNGRTIGFDRSMPADMDPDRTGAGGIPG